MKHNPLYNPAVAVPVIKSYLLDPGRINRLSPSQLENYKTHALKQVLDYAYTIPMYREKYRSAGIRQEDIRGIKDITKLPFITRNDFRDFFPDGVIPADYDKTNGHVICTGGTTGKYCCNSGSQPVCLYIDLPTMLRGIGTSLREHQAFNINWRTARIAHLGNFAPFKFDDFFQQHVQPYLNSFISFDNFLTMNAADSTQELIKRLDQFRPDVIISYPVVFQELASLKRKGYGSHITPKLLSSGGEMLDPYTRWYVESTFHCPMYNIYGSCESGANIAFECTEHNWHIHADYFHIETIDKNNNLITPGERGRIVVTRLWKGATPIIRYTGMEDWITLSDGKACGCGLRSPILERPVEGRVAANIVLPNGSVFAPSEFLFITSILIDEKAFKVRRYQIIQREQNDIEILLVIDPDLQSTEPSTDGLIRRITTLYEAKVGPGVHISVREVDGIPDDPVSGKPAPLIVTSRQTCQIQEKKNNGVTHG
jgi:phenylacetate-CoA ligase